MKGRSLVSDLKHCIFRRTTGTQARLDENVTSVIARDGIVPVGGVAGTENFDGGDFEPRPRKFVGLRAGAGPDLEDMLFRAKNPSRSWRSRPRAICRAAAA